MGVRVVVFCVMGTSSGDEKELRSSLASVGVANQKYLLSTTEEAISDVSANGVEFCHLMEQRTLVLPTFYEVMVAACEHTNSDYVFCHCVDLGRGKVVSNPLPNDFVPGQILVRSWVLRELGPSQDPMLQMGRVLSEYRGVEVPHVLCVETCL